MGSQDSDTKRSNTVPSEYHFLRQNPRNNDSSVDDSSSDDNEPSENDDSSEENDITEFFDQFDLSEASRHSAELRLDSTSDLDCPLQEEDEDRARDKNMYFHLNPHLVGSRDPFIKEAVRRYGRATAGLGPLSPPPKLLYSAIHELTRWTPKLFRHCSRKSAIPLSKTKTQTIKRCATLAATSISYLGISNTLPKCPR